MRLPRLLSVLAVVACAAAAGCAQKSSTNPNLAAPQSTATPTLGGTAAIRDGDLLVFHIGGQCGSGSYLHNLRVIDNGKVIWEIRAGATSGATPIVRVGTLPSGFIQVSNQLAGHHGDDKVTLVFRTNFWFASEVGALADGQQVQLRPQPVLNETTNARQLDC